MTLTAPISLTSNVWHMIACSYTSSNSALYVDGQLAASGSGVAYLPGHSVMTNGLTLGSDAGTGLAQVKGQLSDIETWDYPWGGGFFASYYNSSMAMIGNGMSPGGLGEGGVASGGLSDGSTPLLAEPLYSQHYNWSYPTNATLKWSSYYLELSIDRDGVLYMSTEVSLAAVDSSLIPTNYNGDLSPYTRWFKAPPYTYYNEPRSSPLVGNDCTVRLALTDTAGDPTMLIVLNTADGSTLWTAQDPQPAGSTPAGDLALDANGNTYVPRDTGLRVFAPGGALKWVYYYPTNSIVFRPIQIGLLAFPRRS